MEPKLTGEEYTLVRQAVLNQEDEEIRAVKNIECGNCRRREEDARRGRKEIRRSALAKLFNGLGPEDV